MPDRIVGWDLPPGCSPPDIPGNRPEDATWEKIVDDFYGTLNDNEKNLVNCQDTQAVTEKAIQFGIDIGRQDRYEHEEERYYRGSSLSKVLSDMYDKFKAGVLRIFNN